MKRITLRQRLHSLLFRWFLIFLGISGLAMGFFFSRFRDAAVDEHLLLGRAMARYLDSSIAELYSHLRLLTAAPDFVDSRSLPKLRESRLRHVFRDAVYVLDEDGEVVLADPPTVTPLPTEELAPRERVTPLFYKDGAPHVALVQPFEKEGTRYFLVAEMALGSSALSTILRELSVDSTLHVFVVDAQGVILAAPDPRQVEREIPAGYGLRESLRERRAALLSGAPCWVCEAPTERAFATFVAPLEMAPWGVVLQQPRERAFAAVYASLATFLGNVTLLAVVLLFLAWTLSRTVIAPIRQLSERAELMREGDLSHPIEVEGDHEIDILARTLDAARQRLVHTLEELRDLTEGLEGQVEERTREIEGLLERALAQDEERRGLVRRLLSAGEEERKRIARELHDEISQLLAVVQLSLEELPDSREVKKASNLLAKTQKELHRLIYDLRPSLLDDLGLAAAVKWYAANYLAPRGLEVHLEVEEELRLRPEIEITLFRIYQEIVTNILRHAGAENVSVELYATDRHLRLAVEDDGAGFEVGERRAGAGILGMRERAEIVGGTVHIDSEPGLGTQVVVDLPCDSEEAS